MSWTPSPDQVVGSLRQGRQPDGDPLADLPIRNDWEACPDQVQGSLRQGVRAIEAGFNGLGAGRTLDVSWPPPFLLTTTTNSPGTAVVSRQGVLGDEGTVEGQAPGVTAGRVWKGRPAYRMSATTGIVLRNVTTIDVHTGVGGADLRGDKAFFHAKAILAAEPAGGGDIGLHLKLDTSNGSVMLGPTAGMILRPNADNTVTFAARAVEGGALTIQETCPIDIDVQDFNAYMFRWSPATFGLFAVLEVLINDQLQFRYQYDDDALLPTGVLTVVVGSRGGGRCYVPPMGVNVAAAPAKGLLA